VRCEKATVEKWVGAETEAVGFYCIKFVIIEIFIVSIIYQ